MVGNVAVVGNGQQPSEGGTSGGGLATVGTRERATVNRGRLGRVGGRMNEIERVASC